jgi:hypothetical protein
MYDFIIVTSCLVNEYGKRRRRNKPKSKKTKN